MKRSKKTKRPILTDKEEEEIHSNKILKEMSSKRMTREFFNVDTIELAKKLLGYLLVRQNDDGTIIKGQIVETEAYLGFEDKASNTYNGRKSDSNSPMYMQPGTMFVYMTYGMYHCFNIVSKGNGAGVLIRAVEPLEGIDIMQQRRLSKMKVNNKKPLKTHDLCNGPSKLCLSYDLTKKNSNTLDICSWSGLWIEQSDKNNTNENFDIVSCPRIGIDRAGIEWASKPLRFYILGNTSVSKRNKKFEEECVKE